MMMSAPRLIVTNFKWVRKNTLLATVEFEIPRWQLKIRGVMWHQKNNNEWVAFPSREWIGRDGQKQFAVLLEFNGEDVDRRFKAAVLAAIRAVAEARR